ncbi:response regulator [Duganella sp. CY15W]|uniref:response regulator transcription factor n=1 Tax=Duganella sp. CY15W TaxID=2692172 RepID=UPI001369E02C|nr:response regulator transcription factor [Duganella sp. CY15W]MYM31662.1 response regulator [Duganella sp. CY15W]
MSGAPIALVEDNASLRAELAFYLEHAGYHVTGLRDGVELDVHLARQPCRLVVLDLGLPGEDGLAISTRLRRSHPHLGLVMLTARGMARDRLAGLQTGADYYLVKPAPPEELLAIIGNLLLRLAPAQPVQAPSASWQLRLRSRTLAAPDGVQVDLTHMESVLLQTLQASAPAPASRRQLVEALGGNYLQFEERRLEVAISRLRSKLAQVWPDTEALRAARGIGYLLTLPCERSED